MRFPYKPELRQAYTLTIQNPWLWVFGLFLGSIGAGFNFGPDEKIFQQQDAITFLKEQPLMILGIGLLVIGGVLLFLVLQGLARGATIWSAGELLKPQEKRDKKGVSFRRALTVSKSFFNKIVGFQVSVMFMILVLLVLLSAPIVFLFSLGAMTKAWVLVLLALILFVPVVFLLLLSTIFGPIFIVLYQTNIIKSFELSFKLIKQKLFAIIGISVALMVVGLAVTLATMALAMLLGAFGFILALVAVNGISELPGMILFFGAMLIGLLCVIVLGAAYQVFNQIVWVIAVKKMMVDLELDEPEEEALAAEPAS